MTDDHDTVTSRRHDVALRLCTQGSNAPALPLRMEYDVVGVETMFLSAVPTNTSITTATGDHRTVVSVNTMDSFRFGRNKEYINIKQKQQHPLKNAYSEGTATTFGNGYGGNPEEVNVTAVQAGKFDKNALLRKMGIVPLNSMNMNTSPHHHHHLNQEHKHSYNNNPNNPNTNNNNCCECRDAYHAITTLSSRVESMLCGANPNACSTSNNMAEQRDDASLSLSLSSSQRKAAAAAALLDDDHEDDCDDVAGAADHIAPGMVGTMSSSSSSDSKDDDDDGDVINNNQGGRGRRGGARQGQGQGRPSAIETMTTNHSGGGGGGGAGAGSSITASSYDTSTTLSSRDTLMSMSHTYFDDDDDDDDDDDEYDSHHPYNNRSNHLKVKILNGDESLEKVLDSLKSASMKHIQEDPQKHLRGVAYLERFNKINEEEQQDTCSEAAISGQKMGAGEQQQQQQRHVDENIVGLVANSCANTDVVAAIANNNSNNSNNNNAASSYNHHFNIDQTTPHWSTVSSAEGDLDGNDVVDNRDATNSFGVGAYTTSKEECVSLSTSGTCSPPEDGQYAGSRYAYGNVVESREPLGRTKNVHTTISGSSSSDNVRTTRRVAGRRE